jgi:hypothetical protein
MYFGRPEKQNSNICVRITNIRLLELTNQILPSPTELKAVECTVNFERSCLDMNYGHCLCCRQVRLGLQVNKNGVCTDCSKKKNVNYYLEHKMLPVWYKEGVVQYHVPTELSCLTMAERMLIQMASPFIPLRHISKGVLGMKGHVCCFDQDLESFVNTLPRNPTDVLVLQVLKEVDVEFGSPETRTSCFKVRRKEVGEALVWLKQYNQEYKHINIDMSALDWLKGDVGSLDVFALPTVHAAVDKDEANEGCLEELGPCRYLTNCSIQDNGHVKAFGYYNEAPSPFLCPDDVLIHNEIVAEIDRSPQKKDIVVQWPTCGPVAINEYSSKRIFVRAFPWLFPGGVGDVKDAGDDFQQWGQRLLYYEDGRFAVDKYFTFYALNYITRHRNAKSGSWFLDKFNKDGPQNLAELKTSIRQGNTQFINRLMYFNQAVMGSTSYWCKKRGEVYAWMNHHVEAGHGPPNLFITLSCAEYYWPDVLRLIKTRMEIAKDGRAAECHHGSKKLSEILNDYTVVVQEFFQGRFTLWMQHFGEPILGISHYWGRYEFAPGRGQIHIHLLAIRKDQQIFKLCHEDLKLPDGKVRRDARLAKWASDQFQLTASVDEDFHDRIISPEQSPCSVRLCDVNGQNITAMPDSKMVNDDQQNLIKFCQVHDCNGFCLRKKDNKRYVIPCL